MLRTLCLIILFILPHLAFADALEAVAFAKLAPFLLGILILVLILLVAGTRLSLADFTSVRKNPRFVTLLLIVVALAVGIYAGSVSSAISKNRNSFPNLLTQLYVPIAVLLIGLKKIRGGQQQKIIMWTGIVAAALLTIVAAVITPLVTSNYSYHTESQATIAWVFSTPIIWYIVFKQLSVPNSTSSNGIMLKAWCTPLLGAGLAVAYDTFLQAARTWLIQSMRPARAHTLFDTSFFQLQILCFTLNLVFGILLLLATSWHPTSQPPERGN